MEILSRYGYLPKLSFSNYAFFKHCQYGKQTRNVDKTHVNSSTPPLDLCSHECVWLYTHKVFGWCIFIDDATRKV